MERRATALAGKPGPAVAPGRRGRWGLPWAAGLTGVALLAWGTGPASAAPHPVEAPPKAVTTAPSAVARWRTLDASTEAPRFALEWRGAARARLGAALPLFGRRGPSTLALDLVPLVELHNGPHPDSPIPNESWRGRVGLEGWWRALGGERRRLELGLAVEHESDHDTARVDSLPWFLSLNDVSLNASHYRVLHGVGLALRTRLRTYFLTCTRIGACDEPMDGSSTVGGAAALAIDLGDVVNWGGFGPFAAVEASGLAPRLDVHSEQRVVGELGLHHERGSAGRWQLVLLGAWGNDVGLRRYQGVHQVGVGLRWSPAD
jgi:hypothetical protein